MLVEDRKPLEEEYFFHHHSSVIPDLLCKYYDSGEYELTAYLAEEFQNEYGAAEFYLMLSLFELGYDERAIQIYRRHEGDWYQLFKQFHIYWKHIVLFALYFQDYRISEYYQTELDRHIDDVLVQLLEMLSEEPVQAIVKTELYRQAAAKFPALCRLEQMGKRKEPAVLTFQNVQWKIWEKYNGGLSNGGKLGMEKVYDRAGIRIYSYKPKETAASLHLITDGVQSLMLDCGCEMMGERVVRLPVQKILEELKLPRPERVFISHAHKDHYGSLQALKGQRLVMTPLTKELIRYSAPELALDTVETLNCYTRYAIGGIVVHLIPNGHIQGSVMVDIDWKGTRILYTGDYSVEKQHTVEGFCVKDIFDISAKKIDVLLTETTYGRKPEMFKLSEYEQIFVKICQKELAYGNKLLIPCFGLGRLQEAALLLENLAKQTGARLLLDSMAVRQSEFYQLLTGAAIINRNMTLCRSEQEFLEKAGQHDILLINAGMLREGSSSARCLSEWIEEEHICVIKVGLIREHEHMLLSVINRKHKNLRYLDIPLSAHAGYQSLVETTEALSPECAVYVHGRGIAQAKK